MASNTPIYLGGGLIVPQQFVITVGIPASGKSTYARELEATGKWYRSERDLIRAQNFTETGNIHDYKYTKQREKEVTALQEANIREAVDHGYNIVVSDTNLNRQTRNRLGNLGREMGLEVLVKVFDTPLYQCVKRNAKRDKSVPESVLIRMEGDLRKYLGKYHQDIYRGIEDKLPSCVIVDIDGTLANMRGIRGPFD